jgi:hypothetical protein
VKPHLQLKALDDLEASKGWTILRSTMEREVVQAAMAIAQSPQMPLDEINFRRGAIWAAQQLLDLPTRLRLRLQAEERLTRDDEPAPPPA